MAFLLWMDQLNAKFQIKLIQIQHSMDPRPYHFDYRRPRPNNPTFQSNHFHQSMQQLAKQPLSKSFFNPELHLPSLSQRADSTTLKRANSSELSSAKQLQQELTNRSSKADYSSVEKASRVMAGYGRSVLGGNQRYQIFQKQAHDFDIITYGPKSVRPLRRFPKLTLEDKLHELGLYPNASE